jgi:hypothetical protein
LVLGISKIPKTNHPWLSRQTKFNAFGYYIS